MYTGVRVRVRVRVRIRVRGRVRVKVRVGGCDGLSVLSRLIVMVKMRGSTMRYVAQIAYGCYIDATRP